jgi:hypothetical protein
MRPYMLKLEVFRQLLISHLKLFTLRKVDIFCNTLFQFVFLCHGKNLIIYKISTPVIMILYGKDH